MTSQRNNGQGRTPMSLGDVVDSFGLTRAHYLALSLVVLGGLFEVLEQLVLSSLGPSLEKAFDIGAPQVSLLSTVTLLAIVVGGIGGGLVADTYGRRRVLTISLGIYCVGSVLSAVSPNYAFLAFSRVITGVGVGGEIAVGLTYLSELTPTRARGVFVSLFNTVSAGAGGFLVYAYTLLVLGPVAVLVGAGPDAWRWVFGLLGLPAVLILFFRRYLPETPAHLLHRGRIDEANHALTRLALGRLRLRRDDEVVPYVDERTASISESAQDEGSAKADLASVLRTPLRRRTIAMGVTAFMAWGSQFSVIILMPLILVDRGYSIGGSLAFTMIQNVGGLVGSCVASYGGFALPRRHVVSIGALAAATSILAFVFLAKDDLLILVIGFLFQMFVLLVNTTIWLWAPELYPTRVRGFGTAVVVNVGFFGGALMPLATSTLFHTSGVFAAFSMVAAMYGVMVIAARFAIESRGVSLEQLHGKHAADTTERSRG